MCGKLDCYLKQFTTLQIKKDSDRWPNTAHFRSPLKPLLLISVFDHIGLGRIKRNFIEPSLELERTFQRQWVDLFPDNQIPSMAESFCQLVDEPFWNLVPQPGQPLAPDFIANSLGYLRERVLGARFSDDLYPLLVMETHREKLRVALVNKYLPTSVNRK